MERRSQSGSLSSFVSIEEDEDLLTMFKSFKNDISRNMDTLRLDLKFVCIQVEKIKASIQTIEKRLSCAQDEQSLFQIEKNDFDNTCTLLKDSVEKFNKCTSEMNQKSLQQKRNVSFELNSMSSKSRKMFESETYCKSNTRRRNSSYISPSEASQNLNHWRAMMKYISLNDLNDKV